MIIRWAFLLLAATTLPQLAQADVHKARSTLGARLVITSQCTTQYTLFGPHAISPISVICSPGATPFTTFSSILYNVAAEPNGANAESQSTTRATSGDPSAADQDGLPAPPSSPSFAADTSVTVPAARPVQDEPGFNAPRATASDTTEIVHVTF